MRTTHRGRSTRAPEQHISRWAVSLCLLLILLTAHSRAQVDQQSVVSTMSGTTTTTNYSFARPNELTIIVSVIGYVQRPGRYEIARSIDLVNLLALAGGTSAEGSASTVKITRRSEVDGRVRMHDVFMDLENLSSIRPEDLALQPGDVIQVSRAGWMTARDIFNVVVSLAIIAGAVADVIWVTTQH
jgi:protein involved in polysaccharide export with SLBB domain